MQIVIDIKDDDYYDIIGDTPYIFIGEYTTREVINAVKKGTPLPKGHGRLIDADKLWDSYHDLDYDFYEAFDLVETIIEADREEEE